MPVDKIALRQAGATGMYSPDYGSAPFNDKARNFGGRVIPVTYLSAKSWGLSGRKRVALWLKIKQVSRILVEEEIQLYDSSIPSGS